MGGAIAAGDVAALEALLVSDPEAVERRRADGTTLLHQAAQAGQIGVIDFLLDAGLDPEIESEWGHTAFEWAANMNQREAALHLRSRGAVRADLWLAAALGLLDEVESYFEDGRLRPGSGRSPRPGARLDGWPEDGAFRSGDAVSDALYIACRNGHLEVARSLRARGADVGVVGYFGARAIHWAAGGGHGEVVDWLIAEGADPNERDPKFGGTAAGWAREFGHTALAERLEDRIGPGQHDDHEGDV